MIGFDMTTLQQQTPQLAVIMCFPMPAYMFLMSMTLQAITPLNSLLLTPPRLSLLWKLTISIP